MPTKFKGPATPLTRSQYGQKARQARDSKLNKLRGMEKTAIRAPQGFKEAVEFSRKKPRG